MFFVIPLFLLCAVVLTLYLVGITVRDAQRIVEDRERKKEKEKDIAAIQFANQNIVSVGVTGCCGCEGTCDCEEDSDEDVFESDLYADPELRRQVKEELERKYTDVSEEMMTEMIDRQIAMMQFPSNSSSRRPSNCSSTRGSLSFCPTPRSNSDAELAGSLMKDFLTTPRNSLIPRRSISMDIKEDRLYDATRKRFKSDIN